MIRSIFLCAIFSICLQAEAQKNYDVLHYTFKVWLDPVNDSIKGLAEIKVLITNKGPLEFDFAGINKEGKGFSVQNVHAFAWDLSKEYKASGVTHKNDIIKFSPNAEKGDTAFVFIQYKGIPADGLIISLNKFGDRTFFADNWPNRAHQWLPCNDRPDDKASFDFMVFAPDWLSVVSNGIKVEEKEVGPGFKLTHWKEDIPQSTKVMVIGAAKFAVKEYADSPKNIPVTAWIYQKDSANGFRDYSPAPEILKFFSGYIAPYPFEKLANVQSTTRFGGMENASAIFYAETSVTGKGTVEDLLAHEIAHQWFGDMASEKSFTHLWLSEGFATYLTNIYLEQKHGRQMLEERMKEDRQTIIEFTRKNKKAVVDSLTPYMDLLNANSYQKGGWVLHMLRDEVGDKTFQKIIQAYYQQYKGGNANSRDFEAVAEKVSGKELTWFFDQWLYRPGIPVLEIKTKLQDGSLFVYITQKEKIYRFNLDFWIVAEDSSVVTNRFVITDKESVFKLPVKGTNVTFSIDPEVKLLFKLLEK